MELHMPYCCLKPELSASWPPLPGLLRSICLVVLVSSIGCQSEDQLPIVPVAGSITFAGKQIPGAMVVLHPKPGSDSRIQPARGSVDAQGKFAITTHEAGDGAAVGEYLVTVVHTPLVKKDGDIGAGPNILPAKYASAASTDLEIKVSAETANLLDLKLAR